MLTKRIAREKVNMLLERMLDKGLHQRRAILFGSVAKESSNENSDIDLALWADEFEGVRSFDYEKIARLMDGLHPLEIHTFSSNEKTSPFINEIEKSGVEIELQKNPHLKMRI